MTEWLQYSLQVDSADAAILGLGSGSGPLGLGLGLGLGRMVDGRPRLQPLTVEVPRVASLTDRETR